MLCRLFFQIYIKIKTEITEIDIAESKIQLISLQLNPREKEGTYRTQEREREETNWTQERKKEPTEPKRERRNQPNSREGEGTNWAQEKGEGTNWTQERESRQKPPQALYDSR